MVLCAWCLKFAAFVQCEFYDLSRLASFEQHSQRSPCVHHDKSNTHTHSKQKNAKVMEAPDESEIRCFRHSHSIATILGRRHHDGLAYFPFFNFLLCPTLPSTIYSTHLSIVDVHHRFGICIVFASKGTAPWKFNSILCAFFPFGLILLPPVDGSVPLKSVLAHLNSIVHFVVSDSDYYLFIWRCGERPTNVTLPSSSAASPIIFFRLGCSKTHFIAYTTHIHRLHFVRICPRQFRADEFIFRNTIQFRHWQ